MLGYQRITDVCCFIQAQDQVPNCNTNHHQEPVCAVSGVNTNSFLELHHNSRRLSLDQTYAAFARANRLCKLKRKKLDPFKAETNQDIKQALKTAGMTAAAASGRCALGMLCLRACVEPDAIMSSLY